MYSPPGLHRPDHLSINRVDYLKEVVVVVVFFTLTDRASTILSNIRGCQSGTWPAGQKKRYGKYNTE